MSNGGDLDYFGRMDRRLSGSEAGVPDYLGQKHNTRNFATQIGIKTTEVYFEGSVRDLETAVLPREFVIKPGFASTSIGVHLLQKSDDVFLELVTGTSISFPELITEYQSLSERYFDDPLEGTVLVEELLRDHQGGTPPSDVRAYMFQGEVGFFLIEDHISGTARASYFNADFSPMLDVYERFGVAEAATHLEEIVERPVPANHNELSAVARRVSTAVPTAFCRVDMYDTPNGIYLGEITFYPGTFYYKNRKLMSGAEAKRLGRMWSESESRLIGSELQQPTYERPRL